MKNTISIAVLFAFVFGVFGQSRPEYTFNTLGTLATRKPVSNEVVTILGQFSAGDWGGGRLYRWDSTNVLSTNINRIAGALSTGRWVYDGVSGSVVTNVNYYGAGNGILFSGSSPTNISANIVAGTNVVLTTNGSGQITIAASGGGGGGSATNAALGTLLDVSTNGALVGYPLVYQGGLFWAPTNLLSSSLIPTTFATDAEVASGFQPLNAYLTSASSMTSSGIVVRTVLGTATARTIIGTGGHITVANGDGIAGNPTISLPNAGVTAGTYTNPIVTFDAQGRATSASTGPSGAGSVVSVDGVAASAVNLADSSEILVTLAGTNATYSLNNLGIGTNKLSAAAHAALRSGDFSGAVVTAEAFNRNIYALGAGTVLTNNSHYWVALTADRTLTFNGSPSDGDEISLFVTNAANRTLTFPSSVDGSGGGTVTSIYLLPAHHELAWARKNGSWVFVGTSPVLDVVSSVSGISVTYTNQTGTNRFTLTGSATVSDGDKGDVTVSGSGATWTIDANSVTLGTDTTGDYIQTITGTANEITVTAGSGAESADSTIALASTLDLTGKTVTVATASPGDNDTSVASTAFVTAAVAAGGGGGGTAYFYDTFERVPYFSAYQGGSSTTLSIVGDSLNVTGTGSTIAPSAGVPGSLNIVSAASIGGNAVYSGNAFHSYYNTNRVAVRFGTPDTNIARIYFGFTSLTASATLDTNNPVGDLALLRYSYDADTNFVAITSNGTSFATNATSIVISTNGLNKAEAVWEPGTGAKFYWNNSLVATITNNLPRTNINMRWMIGIQSRETVAKNIRFRSVVGDEWVRN